MRPRISINFLKWGLKEGFRPHFRKFTKTVFYEVNVGSQSSHLDFRGTFTKYLWVWKGVAFSLKYCLVTDLFFSSFQLHMQYECNRKKKWSRSRRRISFCYQKPSKILLYSYDAQIFQTFFQRGDLVWRPDSYVRSGQWKELYWTHAAQMLFCILKLLYAGTGHLFFTFVFTTYFYKRWFHFWTTPNW